MGGENLFNVFGPTAISLQIFGTSPITLHRDPKKSGYHVSVVGVAYISVLIGFLAYCGYIAVYHGLGLVVQIGQLVVLILHIKIRVILGSICAVVLLATSITKAPTLCRVISGFNEFSTALPHHFTPLFYRSTFFGSITVLIIFVFVSLIQLFVEFENVVAIANGNLSSLYLWSFFVSWVGFDIVSWAVITQLLIYSGMLYYQFRALEIEVAGDLRKANSWKSSRNSVKISTNAGGFLPSLPKNLKNLRHLHTHLTCNAAELNQVFATQILVFITCNTILLCFSLFVLLQNLDQHGDAPPIHVSTLWFCIRIFPIYLAICPFSCIENKVGDLSTTIHVWITKIYDHDILKELYLFANQLNLRKLKFSAHGFFDLENSIITSIIGAAITYLVVLVQFHALSGHWNAEKNSFLLSGASSSNITLLYNYTSGTYYY